MRRKYIPGAIAGILIIAGGLLIFGRERMHIPAATIDQDLAPPITQIVSSTTDTQNKTPNATASITPNVTLTDTQNMALSQKPIIEKEDVQIKVALRTKNYSTTVKINGTDIVGTTVSEPDPIPTGGSAILINKDHSVFSRPDATTQDKEFLSMFTLIALGENTLTATYTKTPEATDGEATITVTVLSSPEDTEGTVIYEAIIKSDREGTLAFPFTLPYIEKPVKVIR